MAVVELSTAQVKEQSFAPFGGVEHQPAPDPELVRRLYVEERLTERTIAKRIGVSRRRVAEALAGAGVERRRPRRECPISNEELAALYRDEHRTVAEIARRLIAAEPTVDRWLSEIGLGEPDPRIDHDRLYHLYVEEHLTVRETAEAFGVQRRHISRELGLAGIAPRPAYERRPRGPRAAVTREVLQRLYVEEGRSIIETARLLGVSTEYLRKQLRAHGIAKRLGGFRPRVLHDREATKAKAVELYASGLSMAESGAQLGISSSTVRDLLHEAKVAVRQAGLPRVRVEPHEHRLLRDLYADKEVVGVLVAQGVVLQDPEHWRRPGPTEVLAPLPLAEDLLVELYTRLGLSTFHIELVCGIGRDQIRARLLHFGIPLRPAVQLCPWMARTYGR